MGEAKGHAVFVPFPSQGHISPMLHLAKLLHSRGIHITFVNTDFNHDRLLRSRGPNSLDGVPSFQFEAIPDGLPPSDPNATQDIPALVQAIMNHDLLDPFKKLILRLNDPSLSSPPVTLIVSDCFMPFTLDAARDLGGLPVTLFWTASACGFMAYAQSRALLDKGIVPFQDPNYMSNGSLDMIVDWVPSMSGIRLADLPSFIRTMDKTEISFNFTMTSVEKSCKSLAPIIFNTFDALEHEVLKDVSKMVGPIYTIGPSVLQLKRLSEHDEEVQSLGSNLWKEDLQCLKWLDTKKPNSVVYVSFGSISTMSKENLTEFAWGLANSKHPFLWVLRSDIVSGERTIVPPEFLAETKDRGMLTSWCDQEKVLNHPSIGAFLTHCGWNSMLDSICGGVPMLCWAYFAEQLTNRWYCCNKWRIGMGINEDVNREDVVKQVRELMEGDSGKEMKRNALEWKKLAEEASKAPNGSSFLDFDELINQLLLPPNPQSG